MTNSEITAQLVNTSFISVSKQYLDQIPVINGQVITIKDEPGIYYDMNDARYECKANSFMEVDTLPEVSVANTLYHNKEDNQLYIYDATASEYKKITIDPATIEMQLGGILYALAPHPIENAERATDQIVGYLYEEYNPDTGITPMCPKYISDGLDGNGILPYVLINASSNIGDPTVLSFVSGNHNYMIYAPGYIKIGDYSETISVSRGDIVQFKGTRVKNSWALIQGDDVAIYKYDNSLETPWSVTKLSDLSKLTNFDKTFTPIELSVDPDNLTELEVNHRYVVINDTDDELRYKLSPDTSLTTHMSTVKGAIISITKQHISDGVDIVYVIQQYRNSISTETWLTGHSDFTHARFIASNDSDYLSLKSDVESLKARVAALEG